MLEMAAGRLFEGWAEGPLTFQPTYKLDFGSKKLAMIVSVVELCGGQATPCMTHRPKQESQLGLIACFGFRVLRYGAVLPCLSNQSPYMVVRLEIYTCVQEILTSDHLPVFATFKVNAVRLRVVLCLITSLVLSRLDVMLTHLMLR